MKTIEKETTKIQITVSSPAVKTELKITEQLLFGLAPPEKGWALGEHQLIDALRTAGEITKGKVKDDDGNEHEMDSVDVYTDEAQALVDAARSFFGEPRSIGSEARKKYPVGLLTMVILPEVKKSAPFPVLSSKTDPAPAG